MNITSLKSVGNLQANYMFMVYIPIVTVYENNHVVVLSGSKFPVLFKTAEIPALTKTYKNVRFMNRQVAIPFGQSHEGEITFSVVMDEGLSLYDFLRRWYNSIDYKNVPGYSPFATATVSLINMEGNATKTYQINGMSPKHIPPITDLNQDNTDGLMTLTVNFAYDSIEYGL